MFGLCSFSFNNYYIVAISWRTPFYGRYHELVGRYEMSIFQMAIDLFPLTFFYRRQDFYRTWLWVARVSKYERGTIYTSQAHDTSHRHTLSYMVVARFYCSVLIYRTYLQTHFSASLLISAFFSWILLIKASIWS
jgi:hypothetical protein